MIPILVKIHHKFWHFPLLIKIFEGIADQHLGLPISADFCPLMPGRTFSAYCVPHWKENASSKKCLCAGLTSIRTRVDRGPSGKAEGILLGGVFFSKQNLQGVVFGEFIISQCTVKRLLYQSMMIFNRSNEAFTIFKYPSIYQLRIKRSRIQMHGVSCNYLKRWDFIILERVDLRFKITNSNNFD